MFGCGDVQGFLLLFLFFFLFFQNLYIIYYIYVNVNLKSAVSLIIYPLPFCKTRFLHHLSSLNVSGHTPNFSSPKRRRFSFSVCPKRRHLEFCLLSLFSETDTELLWNRGGRGPSRPHRQTSATKSTKRHRLEKRYLPYLFY